MILVLELSNFMSCIFFWIPFSSKPIWFPAVYFLITILNMLSTGTRSRQHNLVIQPTIAHPLSAALKCVCVKRIPHWAAPFDRPRLAQQSLSLQRIRSSCLEPSLQWAGLLRWRKFPDDHYWGDDLLRWPLANKLPHTWLRNTISST